MSIAREIFIQTPILAGELTTSSCRLEEVEAYAQAAGKYVCPVAALTP